MLRKTGKIIVTLMVIVPKLVKTWLNDGGAVWQLSHHPNQNKTGRMYALKTSFARCKNN